MDEKQNIMKKMSKMMAIGCGVAFFGFLAIIVIFYVVVKNMNTIQGIFDNIGNEKNDVEKVLNAFSLEKAGTEGEQLYDFLNELASKYNDLEEGTERESDFDLPLIMATLHYEKLFDAKVYQEGTLNSVKLTNRDISVFSNETIDTEYEYKMFYKWAYLMLGTPYSIPDINLRGLTGSLISAKVVSKCVAGGHTLSETKLLKEITDSEMKFSGREENGGIISWILGFFGAGKDHKHNVYREEVEDKVKKAFAARGTDDPITTFINFDQYNPDIQCGAGTTLEHQYIRTMNYDQYKVYLEKIFIPQNFLDCENCFYKDVSTELREKVTANMIRDIFDSSKTFYYYTDLEPVDYANLDYEGNSIPSSVIGSMTSPLVNTSCSVTSPYTDLRGAYPHHAVDTIITGGSASDTVGNDSTGQSLTRDSLVAIADGIVKEVKVLTDRQLTYDEKAGTCTENMNLNGGVYVVIEHKIGGKTYQSKYFHLKKDSVTVKEGDTVKKGQKIAEIGTTGCSTGEHLHFELYDVNEKQNLNPSNLFSKCANWDDSGVIKIPTTDDYYADIMIEVSPNEEEPDKPSGSFPLEVYVTGVVKAEIGGSSAYVDSRGEAFKAQAIAARTYAMYITDWGKEPIENSSNNQNMAAVDIEGKDKALYELVLETQGMVMTRTSDIFMSEYSNWPCQRVDELYLSYADRYDAYKLAWVSYVSGFAHKVEMQDPVLNLVPEDFEPRGGSWGEIDEKGRLTAAYWDRVNRIIDRINRDLSEYYAKMGSCSWYYVDGKKIGDPYFLMLREGLIHPEKVGVDLKYLPLGVARTQLGREVFEVDESYIKKQYYGHNRGMSQIGASYLNSQGYNYVEILDEFYESKDGKTEILTAPGLVRVFLEDGEGSTTNNQVEFDYGELLPGSDQWHTCKASSEEDNFYESELKSYIESVKMNATARGDVNPLRAQVVGAAYWLAFNPYFKVQYQLGGTHPYEGIKNTWGCLTSAPSDMNTPAETTQGLDCNAFVRWAFAQIGKSIHLGTNDGPRRIEKCSADGLTVKQIAQVAQLGDVLIKNRECNKSKYGHVALIFGVNPDAGTFSVIHASGYRNNITITEYDNPNKVTNYNWVLSMSYTYGEG